MEVFFLLFLFPGLRRVRSPPRDFTLMYNIWQDAGNRTRVAVTLQAARCADMSYTYTSLDEVTLLLTMPINYTGMTILYCRGMSSPFHHDTAFF